MRAHNNKKGIAGLVWTVMGAFIAVALGIFILTFVNGISGTETADYIEEINDSGNTALSGNMSKMLNDGIEFQADGFGTLTAVLILGVVLLVLGGIGVFKMFT